MEKHFKYLLETLNNIPNLRELGKPARGKFSLEILKDTQRIGLQVNFVDYLHPNKIHHILMRYYELSAEYPLEKVEKFFIESCYREFITFMLYGRRTTDLIDGFGNKIICIPIADLIQTGLD